MKKFDMFVRNSSSHPICCVVSALPWSRSEEQTPCTIGRRTATIQPDGVLHKDSSMCEAVDSSRPPRARATVSLKQMNTTMYT
jgi:hypothetical protein